MEYSYFYLFCDLSLFSLKVLVLWETFKLPSLAFFKELFHYETRSFVSIFKFCVKTVFSSFILFFSPTHSRNSILIIIGYIAHWFQHFIPSLLFSLNPGIVYDGLQGIHLYWAVFAWVLGIISQVLIPVSGTVFDWTIPPTPETTFMLSLVVLFCPW